MTGLKAGLSLLLILLLESRCLATSAPQVRAISLSSPNRSITVHFAIKENPLPYPKGIRAYYQVTYQERAVLLDSSVSLQFEGQPLLGRDLQVLSVERSSIDETYRPVHGPRSLIRNRCNQAILQLQESQYPQRRLDLVFRTYDEGVAFRYAVPRQPRVTEINLTSEDTTFQFPPGSRAWAMSLGTFTSNYEKEYNPLPLWEIQPSSIVGLPMLVKTGTDIWAGIAEANISNYPGLYLGGVAGIPELLTSRLSPLPDHPKRVATLTAPFVTPWRVLLLADRPGTLVENNTLLMNLNVPSKLVDTAWIKPGKVAWHWWNGTVAKGVNFKTGMNDATLRHYIDFASEQSLQYLQIDDGWYSSVSGTADITRSISEVHIPELVRYASQKNVGILLWLDWKHLDIQMEQAFPLYQSWGIRGVKVDFMNRDDQVMVNFYHRVVQQAAQYRLLVNFHGAFKPDGIQRTWPNIITREAVLGLEWNKFSRRCTPLHDVTLPFTRMLSGPMDYTPGAFRTARGEQFVPRQQEPQAQGTRAHQLALYVVYESPLQMLVDYPEAYRNQTGIEFLKQVPTTWDETRVVQGEVGEFITVARRSGDDWYVGSLTNSERRTLAIPLKFLGAGKYLADIYSDASDADTASTEVRFEQLEVTATAQLAVRLAAGGGQAVRLRSLLNPPKTKGNRAAYPKRSSSD